MLREKVLSTSTPIKDMNTGTPYFIMQGRVLSATAKEQLHDIYDVPIANSRRDDTVSMNRFTIYAGADKHLPKAHMVRRGCCLFAACTFKFDCEVTLTNGQQALVVMKGSGHFDCTMWIGEPKQGGTPVARAFSANPNLGAQYALMIAPGFDAALAVLLLHIYESATVPPNPAPGEP